VTLKGRPWTTFVDGYEKGEYPVFGRGWYPDFPDADNYISPFVSAQNALGTPYESPQITDKPLPESRREIDRTYAVPQFREVQQILAGDARLIPLWQGKQYLAAHKDISARNGRWTRRRS
jgi:peptide/nickel transport system substrate-binding protein